MELADTSAWVWTRAVGGELRTAFDEAIIEGDVASCDMVRLELLYSARTGTEFTIQSTSSQAAAESAGIAVLHYDEDYDCIAAITGQDVRWLAPRGSLR